MEQQVIQVSPEERAMQEYLTLQEAFRALKYPKDIRKVTINIEYIIHDDIPVEQTSDDYDKFLSIELSPAAAEKLGGFLKIHREHEEHFLENKITDMFAAKEIRKIQPSGNDKAGPGRGNYKRKTKNLCKEDGCNKPKLIYGKTKVARCKVYHRLYMNKYNQKKMNSIPEKTEQGPEVSPVENGLFEKCAKIKCLQLGIDKGQSFCQKEGKSDVPVRPEDPTRCSKKLVATPPPDSEKVKELIGQIEENENNSISSSIQKTNSQDEDEINI